DVGLHHGPRAALRRPRTPARAAPDPIPDPGGSRPRRRRAAEPAAAADPGRAGPGPHPRPCARDRPLELVLRAARGASVDPAATPRTIRTRRSPARRRLRPRLRDLLPGADGAAVVGGGERLHRG